MIYILCILAPYYSFIFFEMEWQVVQGKKAKPKRNTNWNKQNHIDLPYLVMIDSKEQFDELVCILKEKIPEEETFKTMKQKLSEYL